MLSKALYLGRQKKLLLPHVYKTKTERNY
jgi:hypothetical protein